jgi:ethanolamine transporter EutH
MERGQTDNELMADLAIPQSAVGLKHFDNSPVSEAELEKIVKNVFVACGTDAFKAALRVVSKDRAEALLAEALAERNTNNK